MHERTSLADELHDAMLDAPDLCAQCGAILSDTEPYLCDACTETASCEHSDICEPWDVRMTPYYAPSDRFGISVLGVLLLATFLAVIVGTAGLERVKAQDTTATRTINGRPYEWTLPEAGCALIRGWEDMSAQAWCPGGMVRYDPEDDAWYAVENTR